MHTPWGRKRRRLAQLERIAACRVVLRDIHGELLGSTVEELFLAATFGHDGRVEIVPDVDLWPVRFTFTT